MLYEILDHRRGVRSIPPGVRMGVENLLDSITYPDGKLSTQEVIAPIKHGLRALGWSGKVAVASGTNISITSAHSDVGMAVQFGNVSRVYADLMKFQALFVDDKLAGGIMIVPHRDFLSRLSKSGGSDNRCSFERVSREMPIFSKVITMPMLVYGVYTEG